MIETGAFLALDVEKLKHLTYLIFLHKYVINKYI